MQIFVDADACPVVAIVEKVAKMHAVPVTLLCDTNHVLSSGYSKVVGREILLYLRIMVWQQWHWEKKRMPFINPVNGTRMITLIRC